MAKPHIAITQVKTPQTTVQTVCMGDEDVKAIADPAFHATKIETEKSLENPLDYRFQVCSVPDLAALPWNATFAVASKSQGPTRTVWIVVFGVLT